MNKITKVFFSLILIILFSSSAISQVQKTISIEDLLWEMVNIRGLTYLPFPLYTAKQSSSYDRASKSKDQGWFANDDRGQYVKVENTPSGYEKVMLDVQGPGVVTRIWSANAQDGGTIKIYIDGMAIPALEGKMDSLLGGSVEPFRNPIAGQRAKGWNLYFPFPYQKQCKITHDGEGTIYYQINYRTYPKGVNVEPFSLPAAKKLKSQIERISKIFSDPEKEFKDDGIKNNQEFNIPSGKTVIIHQTVTQVPNSISELRIKVSAKNRDEALRGCILIGEFDNEKKPTILCPVGDFFGSAPGINPYNSLPLTVKSDGTMISRWEMPFQRGARLSIRNTTTQEVKIAVNTLVTKYNWNKNSMYFHAKWRKDNINTEPKSDWTYVETKGAGVFVGNMLHVLNPVTGWWGEGDEKIYVDGEKFPSHFGTGTEDYYGYAWCSNEKFYHAYHNQTRCDGPGNQGNTSINRFHIFDNIPFTKSFKFDMEIWHWTNCKMVYSAVSYWYALPGSTDFVPEIDEKKLKVDSL